MYVRPSTQQMCVLGHIVKLLDCYSDAPCSAIPGSAECSTIDTDNSYDTHDRVSVSKTALLASLILSYLHFPFDGDSPWSAVAQVVRSLWSCSAWTVVQCKPNIALAAPNPDHSNL